LKNEKGILPLSKSTKTIAFIGPLVKEYKQNMGFWSVELPELDYTKEIVSQWDGLQNKVGKNTQLLYAKGCDIEGDNKEGFAEAIAVANQADVVILSIGERRDQSGEAKSRSNLRLPGVQEELVKAIQATGKPVVVLINAGRPLIFNWTADQVLGGWVLKRGMPLPMFCLAITILQENYQCLFREKKDKFQCITITSIPEDQRRTKRLRIMCRLIST
jgi:beta-glucosidase